MHSSSRHVDLVGSSQRHRHLCGVDFFSFFVFDEDNILGVSKFTQQEEARWRAKQWWGRNSHLRRCSVKRRLIYASYDINIMLASIEVALKAVTIDRREITCRCL